ncbi:MAG: hydroxyectoine utilization dehydratase EutB [Geminicoccaceae bacterium]|nr:hydroxyectoine utilization dehydratase EutB [Geminicoccaceae bacterium]
MRNDTAVGLDEIERARAAIADRLRPTPIQVSPILSELAGLPVWLKLEHHQITGSFKYRGATHAVLSLSDEEKAKGVVGVSTGNHGRGLALAAREAGVRCIVCMSELVPQVKIDGIRAHGAEVRIAGRSQDDAEEEVRKLVEEEGMTLIPPFDHPKVIAGQGTLGLELIEQVPELRTVLVPLSGGGLISGVAAAIKAKRPHVRIIGVTMERGAAMYASQQAGRPVMVEELPTLADSLGGGIGLDNRYTFTMVRDLVDDIILVSETEIALAISHAYWKERQIVEGSGAVGIAVLLAGKIRGDGPLVAILSGGNIDMNDHLRIITCESDRVTRGPAGHA